MIPVVVLVACRASVEAKPASDLDEGHASLMGQQGAQALEFDDAANQKISGDGPVAMQGARSGTLLGARHDLKLLTAARSGSCSCLAYALGVSADGAFDWLGPPPSIDPQTQLVVAFSSKGQPCADEPEGSLGASYWGYKWSNSDVVVIIEAAAAGRPITTGAIIPKPLADGQVYLQPVDRKTPYGRPVEGGATRCLIGNPGPQRTQPLSPDEVAKQRPEG